MYGLIDAHHSVRAIYTQQLLQRGDITEDDQGQLEADFRARLDTAFSETHVVDQTPAGDDAEESRTGVTGLAESGAGNALDHELEVEDGAAKLLERTYSAEWSRGQAESLQKPPLRETVRN